MQPVMARMVRIHALLIQLWKEKSFLSVKIVWYQETDENVSNIDQKNLSKAPLSGHFYNNVSFGSNRGELHQTRTQHGHVIWLRRLKRDHPQQSASQTHHRVGSVHDGNNIQQR